MLTLSKVTYSIGASAHSDAPALNLSPLEARQYGYGGDAPSTAVSAPSAAKTTASSGGTTSPYGTAAGAGSAVAAGGTGGRRGVATTAAERRNFKIAHGTITALAFVIVFPLGGILVRLLQTPAVVRVHAGVQLFGYSLAIVGLGLGVWLGLNVRYLDYAHTIIGMAVVAALAIQLVLGAVQHSLFQRRKKKSALSHVHVWFGRILLVLGIINGGLGLQLANNSRNGEIAYGVVAGVVGVVYIVVVGLWSTGRTRPRVG
ncbi:MAG: hypothetical protein M1832_003755 [Thelocarpon impressellum]|nr:MAG: hypothetical protein M1832_003755 [Thelocarpon impressellum]